MASEPETSSNTYFLSYSRADERFALRFAKDLRARGVAMWIDQLDIRPSEHWDRAIERAVRDCRGLVVILSPRSVASDNVADEISYAIEHGKSVLPVMIEKCTLPLRITRMQVVDATANYERAIEQCVAETARSGKAAETAGETPARSGGQLNPELLATARRQLTSILGPIAGIVVDKAAQRASSPSELYSLLTLHIENEADRERFAAMTALPKAPAADRAAADLDAGEASPISPADLETVAGVLTRYLGPIAPMAARRESRAAESLEDLGQRLAALIPSERDRAEFLRRLGR